MASIHPRTDQGDDVSEAGQGARAALAGLAARIRELHEPYESERTGKTCWVCGGGRSAGHLPAWPCATIRAVDVAMAGFDRDAHASAEITRAREAIEGRLH
jgi:hypothetical protein